MVIVKFSHHYKKSLSAFDTNTVQVSKMFGPNIMSTSFVVFVEKIIWYSPRFWVASNDVLSHIKNIKCLKNLKLIMHFRLSLEHKVAQVDPTRGFVIFLRYRVQKDQNCHLRIIHFFNELSETTLFHNCKN